MDSPNDEAAARAIRAHHVELRDTLRARVLALRDDVQTGRESSDSRRAVLDYLERELLPHAAAEEEALYPAGDTGLTALLVRAMRDEHRNLVAHVGELNAAADGLEASIAASAVLALFESHLSKENDLLVPALVADPHVSLSELLGGMHELVG
ncbi:MAG TPA: hemerythrin domain-containing protein [Candidatus Saccharimonadales bacterium]|nr:hemerythrin domain-containing protein [Candidatus Saccharimonadales bacterium]